MIQPNELRIGNYILAEVKDWTEGRVVGMTGAGDVFMDLGSVPYQIEDVRPIPLTSEWLERFGFRQQGDRKMWVRDKVAVVWHEGHMFNEDGYYVAFKDMGNVIYHTQCCVEFVHQLQNAYFLTGEELTIKDDGKKEGKEQQESGRAESPAKDSLE